MEGDGNGSIALEPTPSFGGTVSDGLREPADRARAGDARGGPQPARPPRAHRGADAADRVRGHQVRLLPAGLGHRPDHGQGRRRPRSSRRSPSAATSSSTARRPTSSPTATATTSASGPRSPSWRPSPTSTPSGCCPGIGGSRACSATATTRRPGELLDADPRQNLKQIAHEFEQELGYQFLIGIEPEMMWLRKPEDGAEPEGVTKPYCYHIHQFEELRPVLMDVVEYGQALGLDMSYGDHEDAPGQLELNFRFDRPLRTADNISTYRQVCAAVARKHGLLASFMPKPFTGVSANGHHHHFTLMDDDGNNVFHDPSGPAQLSELARHFLGGMLDHFPALMCVGNPTVNSYCRMWDTGFWAPIYKNWGWQNRTTTVRVAAGGRFEYRGVDSSCNPYLTIATLLRAGLDGVRREVDPGPPQQGNTYDLLQEGADIEKVPDSLGAALEALAADEVIRSAMPGPALQGVQPLQARRVGALPGRRHRLGARRVPGGAPVAMCGIAGLIYKNGRDTIGPDMTRMLQSMKHRGPDSTGYALYRPPADDYVMHVKLADANTPRDFEFADRLRRNRAEVERRLRAAGARISTSRSTPPSTRSRSTSTYDGELKDARRPRRGRPRRRGALARARARDRQGPRRRRDRGVRLRARQLRGHARDRPLPDGDRVRRRHLGRAPLLGVSVLGHRRRPQRAAHQLPPVEAPARAQRPPLPVRVRLRDHRRLPGRADERRRLARGRDAPEPGRARRRLHLPVRHRQRARDGQGRAGREAARALRVRRARRARLRGDRDPRGDRPRDRDATTRTRAR